MSTQRSGVRCSRCWSDMTWLRTCAATSTTCSTCMRTARPRTTSCLVRAACLSVAAFSRCGAMLVGRLAEHCGTPSCTALSGAGGGSKTDYHQHSPTQAEQRLFVQGSGFVACELTEHALSCQYYGIGADTSALYSLSIEH